MIATVSLLLLPFHKDLLTGWNNCLVQLLVTRLVRWCSSALVYLSGARLTGCSSIGVVVITSA